MAAGGLVSVLAGALGRGRRWPCSPLGTIDPSHAGAVAGSGWGSLRPGRPLLTTRSEKAGSGAAVPPPSPPLHPGHEGGERYVHVLRSTHAHAS